MSVNNVIDPSDLFRELSAVSGGGGGGGGEGVSPVEVNRLADQLTATTDNIRTIINRQHAQKAQAAHQLDLAASSGGGELEDIAKQIADHAETLYQTWKARGLAPADVLKSHNTTSLNNEAAQTLSRQLREGGSRATTPSCRSPTPAGRAAAAAPAQLSPSSPQPLEHTIPIRLERGSQPRVNGAEPPPAERRQPPADRWRPQQQQHPGQQQQQQQQHQQEFTNQHINQQHVQKLVPQQQQQQQQQQQHLSQNVIQPAPQQQHSPPMSQQQQTAGTRREPTAHGRTAPPPDRWKPQQQQQQQQQQRGGISPADLLASPDSDRSLEELVKNFVQEDKARRGGPSSPTSPPAGYQTLPARTSDQRAYRGAKTAPSLLSPPLNSRLQVSTNGERRVLEAGDEPDSSTATWPLKARTRPADQPRSMATEQAAVPAPLAVSSATSAAAAAAAEAERAADAALAEVRQQEEQLRSALQSGSLIPPRRDVSPRPDGLAMSTVDYAKLRFQDPQQRSRAAQRLEDSRSLVRAGATGAQVTEARSRYDNGQINISDSQWRSEWLPSRFAVDPDSGVLLPSESWRRKRVLQKAAGDTTRTVSPLPHPQLTEEQKAHIRERTLSPTPYNAAGVAIRPFLTQGSVAERVSIFEKCPAELRQRASSTELQDKMRQPAISAWRAQNEVKDKAQTYGRERDGRSSTESPPASSPKSPPRRPANARPANRSALIPKFHFPNGRPESREKVEAQLQRIQQAFASYPGGQVPKDKFAAIAKACELPLYWKVPLFLAAGGEKTGHVTAAAFLDFWKRLLATSHDQASRFVRVLTSGQRTHLVPEDLVPLVQDVVETHPGLNFLKEAIEFHSRYVHTVIARIFYCVNRSWSGRITVAELRRSNLLKTIQLLEQEEDINQITDYFSYEHFYVIYCKFWELDKDHDLLIDKSDVARHNDHAVSSRIIDRIFSGAVTRGSARKQEKMTYMEFVWFLLSEEDKKHPTAIEYWFRCMDLDGDGYLSMYELEYFYEEQLQRMEALGLEALPFEDCLCWMLDMVQPETPGKIALSDLKQCQMSNIFFDTFFNLEKYLEHDQRDPFAMQRDGEPGQPVSDWDRFAAEEYELLVAEEGAAEQEPEFLYEEDGEPGSEPLERLSITEPGRPQQPARPPPDADDDYAETDADYTYISDSAGSPVYGQAKVV